MLFSSEFLYWLRFLLEFPDFKGIVVVDEAYTDFVSDQNAKIATTLVKEYANICGTNTEHLHTHRSPCPVHPVRRLDESFAKEPQQTHIKPYQTPGLSPQARKNRVGCRKEHRREQRNSRPDFQPRETGEARRYIPCIVFQRTREPDLPSLRRGAWCGRVVLRERAWCLRCLRIMVAKEDENVVMLKKLEMKKVV
ncbi:hypothetical protein GALMADRAFT_235406 [Galerina marginata CBS 339.88]|uniref:Uncharacterized protein n=1 Tax=Galerina marginata (strain CBS 339.88) TaxID=685588 RepID=A0A067TWD5_GALM3|nr:hypothetical protein GALMADRAFT_235406 [Galerina marginata CBS 339.88]